MTIQELVEKYERDHSQYIGTAYNETQLRNDFLDPFWYPFVVHYFSV